MGKFEEFRRPLILCLQNLDRVARLYHCSSLVRDHILSKMNIAVPRSKGRQRFLRLRSRLYAGRLIFLVFSQRADGLTTWNIVTPIRTFFQLSSAKASESSTTKFGLNRFIGTGESSLAFRSANDASPINIKG